MMSITQIRFPGKWTALALSRTDGVYRLVGGMVLGQGRLGVRAGALVEGAIGGQHLLQFGVADLRPRRPGCLDFRPAGAVDVDVTVALTQLPQLVGPQLDL